MKLRRFLRMDAVMIGTAVLAGLALGAALRVAMRVVALTDREPGTTFTVGGTIGILIFSVVISVPFAAIYLAVRRLLPSTLRARRVAFGLVLLVLPGVPFLLGFSEIREIGHPWLNRVMFGSVILVWGIAVSGAFEWLDRTIRRPGARPEGRVPEPATAQVR
jgi:hypothetical protein